MTYTSIHYDSEKSSITIGIASYLEDVGKRCVYIDPWAGCVIAQGLVTNSVGPEAIALLSRGVHPKQVLDTVLAKDALKNQRQILIMDRFANTTIYSGEKCNDYYGEIITKNLIVAGNCLSSVDVLKDMINSYKRTNQKDHLTLALSALTAGELAGGDMRGRKAAAIYHLELAPDQTHVFNSIKSYSIKNHEKPLVLLKEKICITEEELKVIA